MMDFELSRNPHGSLVFTDRRSGAVHVGAVPVRAFPIGAPDQGIALLSAEGHELAWVDALNQLPAPLRSLLEEELNRREFLPEIRRIKSAVGHAAHSLWQVQTDRGDTELALKGEESIRRIGQGALVVTDVHGVQFLIRDFTRLDRASRKVLDRVM